MLASKCRTSSYFVIVIIIIAIITIVIIYRGHIVVNLGQRLSCAGLKTQDKAMKDLSSLSQAHHCTHFVCCVLIITPLYTVQSSHCCMLCTLEQRGPGRAVVEVHEFLSLLGTKIVNSRHADGIKPKHQKLPKPKKY